jgi:hypothetical protein
VPHTPPTLRLRKCLPRTLLSLHSQPDLLQDRPPQGLLIGEGALANHVLLPPKGGGVGWAGVARMGGQREEKQATAARCCRSVLTLQRVLSFLPARLAVAKEQGQVVIIDANLSPARV